jgi:hypothetical protein
MAHFTLIFYEFCTVHLIFFFNEFYLYICVFVKFSIMLINFDKSCYIWQKYVYWLLQSLSKKQIYIYKNEETIKFELKKPKSMEIYQIFS